VTTPAATADLVRIAAGLGQFASRSDAIRYALKFTAERMTLSDALPLVSAPAATADRP
jgi:Arc/MetJ-type ribon-helix-helix transcriptional regulator